MSPSDPTRNEDSKPTGREVEFSGPVWKHPYFLYIILTGALFVGAILLAYIGLHFDLIPKS